MRNIRDHHRLHAIDGTFRQGSYNTGRRCDNALRKSPESAAELLTGAINTALTWRGLLPIASNRAYHCRMVVQLALPKIKTTRHVQYPLQQAHHLQFLKPEYMLTLFEQHN